MVRSSLAEVNAGKHWKEVKRATTQADVTDMLFETLDEHVLVMPLPHKAAEEAAKNYRMRDADRGRDE
jgi:hypothetical protein